MQYTHEPHSPQNTPPRELLVFVADNSGTFYGQTAQKANAAITTLAHHIDQKAYKVSHITFGSYAYLLKKATVPNHLVPALDGTDGGTRLGPAMGLADAEIHRFKSYWGANCAASILVISDGNICDLEAANPIATAIKNGGTRIISVATGSQPNCLAMLPFATSSQDFFCTPPAQLTHLFKGLRRYFPPQDKTD